MKNLPKKIYINHSFYLFIVIAILVIEVIKFLVSGFKAPTWGISEATSIATIAQAIFAGGIAFQIWQSKQGLSADHERSRRERAIEILMEWTKNLSRENLFTRKILDTLSEDQCKSIFRHESFKMDKKHHLMLMHVIREIPASAAPAPTGDDDLIEISDYQSSTLRWHALSYLNSLEFTLIAWQYSIADREIIETQFQYLYNSSDGTEVLKNFRKAAGGSTAFPAIEVFTAHLAQKSKDQLIRKSNIA